MNVDWGWPTAKKIKNAPIPWGPTDARENVKMDTRLPTMEPALVRGQRGTEYYYLRMIQVLCHSHVKLCLHAYRRRMLPPHSIPHRRNSGLFCCSCPPMSNPLNTNGATVFTFACNTACFGQFLFRFIDFAKTKGFPHFCNMKLPPTYFTGYVSR